MTDYCKRVLEEYDEAAAQMRELLEASLDIAGPTFEHDGGGSVDGTKIAPDGEALAFIGFAWGDVAGEFHIKFAKAKDELMMRVVEGVIQ